jgi:hypothetical protein
MPEIDIPFKWPPGSLADVSTHIGLVVGIVGFALTIWQLSKTKTAAIAAQTAADNARKEIHRLDSIIGLNEIEGLISEIKSTLLNTAAHPHIPEKCARTRRTLQKVRAYDELKDAESQKIFQDAVFMLRQFEDEMATSQIQMKKKPNFSSYYSDLNKHLDSVIELFNKLKKA